MRSKMLVFLFAVLLVPVCGAFAAAPELVSTPAVDHPVSAEEFVKSLSVVEQPGKVDPLQPLQPENKVIISCAACSSNANCLSICAPGGFCGGTCNYHSSCGRKVCNCLQCP